MIPHDDRGLTLGDGLFETILSLDGELVWLDEHLQRLAAGCAALALPAPDLAEARRLCEEAARTVAGRAAVRLTVTAGSGGRGLDRPDRPEPRLFATAAPAPMLETPATLLTTSVRRNEGSPASRLKTLAYLDNVLARAEARAAGADEALMLNNRGEVACASAANVFWIKGSTLFTPALVCGVLPGIVRARVLAAAAAAGFVPVESEAGREEISSADGIFVTNSLILARPVGRLDGIEIPQGSTVKLISALQQSFAV